MRSDIFAFMHQEIHIKFLIFSPDEKKKRKREEAEKKPDVSRKLTIQIHELSTFHSVN